MTRDLQYTLDGYTDNVTSLAIFQSSENNILASGSFDETIKLWNLTDYTLISTLSEFDSGVCSLLIFQETENSKPYLISGHYDVKIMILSE